MNIHTLEKNKHKEFLEQERIDPITGDLLEENDKVVICASCKSAFLADSWAYMENKHCNQIYTLEKIPKNEIIVIDKSKPYLHVNLSVEVISNNKAVKKASLWISHIGVSIYLISLFVFPTTINFVYAPVLIFTLFYLPRFLFWLFSNYKEYLDIKENTLSFSLPINDREIGDKIRINSIKDIRHYKSSRYWGYNFIQKMKYNGKELHTLEFLLKDKKKYKVLITHETLKRINYDITILQEFNKNPLNSLSVN